MDRPIIYSQDVDRVLKKMFDLVAQHNDEYATPEHLLLALLDEVKFRRVLDVCGADYKTIDRELLVYIDSLDKQSPDMAPSRELSMQLEQVLGIAASVVVSCGRTRMMIPHVVKGIFELQESLASYTLLSEAEFDEASFMSELVSEYDPAAALLDDVAENNYLAEEFDELDESGGHPASAYDSVGWRSLVVCVNENLQSRNPLIGREKELEHTMRVLSRKDKNNVLHIGEPGVGKTALVYGLARLINAGTVPESLKDAKIYQLDMGTLLAGTQFRGDFEKRLKMIMEGISSELHPIVYIDEIHNLVGAGATGEGAMDASNMLKPYLEAGKIRFIGATTYEEYKRYFAKSKGLVRRFRQIDIVEPSIEETREILSKLKESYEQFHRVTYTDEALDFAVKGSARHITDRFLPDKAIDLIDEAGAYRKMHPGEAGSLIVDDKLIASVLAKICKVEALATNEDDEARLVTLRERLTAQIYGQDEAIKEVTEAVQMSKAGLTEDNKPLASLLFVGPTGVGKTEVAKVLAAELGIELLRFDMSEYTEKHAVAKLIGSPAGYVGYEDGGLLTDAVRKNPNVVLLLDEIEKAHSDIYNILLQVMDYARLTDNKGNHADFRNVVLIMTSNAGAQYAAQAKVGFGNTTGIGTAMMKEVKKIFKPEFLNRLSGTVVFHDMTREMASLILEKKLNQLRSQLKARNVTLSLSDEARKMLLNKGFTKEYGARELDRVISSLLKPLLMRSILFGKLKNGGSAEVEVKDDQLILL